MVSAPKKKYMIQFLIALFLFVSWFIYSFYVFNKFTKKFDTFCENNYYEVVVSCKRVKGWVNLELESGNTLSFGLYTTEENVSEQFAKEVEKGDIFIKNNSTSENTLINKS